MVNKEKFLTDMKAVFNHYADELDVANAVGNELKVENLSGTLSIMKVLIEEIELGKYDN